MVSELQPEYGDYTCMFGQMLSQHDGRIEGWSVYESRFPNSISQCDVWLISGSKFGVYEDHPWIPNLEEFIRQCHSNRLPLIGVCFGHQIIAQALGGIVEKFSGGWCIGRTRYDFLGHAIHLNSWHQDQVIHVPENSWVLGGNDFCRNAFIDYGDNTFSLQPHPEFDHGFIEGLIEYRGRGVPKSLLEKARQGLGKDVDDVLIKVLIENLLESQSLAKALAMVESNGSLA